MKIAQERSDATRHEDPTVTIVGPADGALWVASEDDQFASRYALRCGERLMPFKPAGRSPAGLLKGLNLLGDGHSTPADERWRTEKPSVPIVVGIDHPAGYVLSGERTDYISFDRSSTPTTLSYVAPGSGPEIPLLPGERCTLSGYFGCHRARASLRLTIVDADGAVLYESEEPLSNAYHAGKELGDYQHIAITTEIPEKSTFARITLDLHASVVEAGAKSTDSFVFVTRLGLFHGDVADRAEGPAIVDVSGLAAVTRGEANLFTARIDVDRAAEASELAVEPLEGEPTPVARYAVPRPISSQATIALHGNALEIQVSGYAGRFQLLIDGEHAGWSNLRGEDRDEQAVRMVVPDQFLDGQVHYLELRDASMLRVIARGVEIFPSVLTPWEALQRYSTPPLPYQLAPSSIARYRALNTHVARAGEAIIDGASADDARLRRFALLPWLHEVLVTGFEQLREFRPLEFPAVAAPDVSVVVPVHDQFATTYHGLCGLLFAANEASFEVIVVDDGSSDRTSDLESLVSGVTVVRSEVAEGFVRAVNRGAQEARGRFVALLNNDTEPTTGWLDELIAAFETFEDVGMAGSKLVYPDGRLQEAGGIIWSDGNPWNYGRGGNARDPKYCYARQADYLSGAAVMLPRAVWEEVGGLSEEFVPAYFEDTDLAFKVRAAGYTTWYVPTSVVFHFEGISNGRDVDANAGLKRFQEINRPKFKRKWAHVFSKDGAPLGDDPDLVKDRGIVGRVLFIDQQVPMPDHDAGGYAAVQDMRLVQSLGYKVTFISTNVAYMGRYDDELNRLGIETGHAPFDLSIDDFLKRRGAEFDVIVIERYNVAETVLANVREHSPKAKVILNVVDLHFLRQLRAAIRSKNEQAVHEAATVRDAELAILRQVDLVLTYSDVERSVILSHNLSGTKSIQCPWVVDTLAPEQIVPASERSGICFLGGFRHPPNAEAVEFFVQRVVPLLRKRLPGVAFHIYGSRMPDEIAELADETVKPEGYVRSVDEVFTRHRVFVAPLQSGAGVKGKVLSALSFGIPSVLSPIAAEGTGVRDGSECVIVEEPAEWVDAVASLYEDADYWRRMSDAALEFTRTNYSFERGRAMMRKAFEEVALYKSLP